MDKTKSQDRNRRMFERHPGKAWEKIRKQSEKADLYFVDPELFYDKEICEADLSSACMSIPPKPELSVEGVAEVYSEKVQNYIIGEPETCIKPELEERLKSLLQELMEEGVPLRIIHEWLDSHIHLSRLTVTERYKIILKDYGDIEITMGPLPKTVFLFYLRHPEGVDFADLMDYRGELMDIYSRITSYDDAHKLEESIDRLIDPFDNSINEKCSAIRKAFTQKLDPSVARYYYVNGSQGCRKYIQLDRKMVIWE